LEIYNSALEWGAFVRRWLTVNGVQVEIHTGAAKGLWPSDETVRQWDRRIDETEAALKKVSVSGFAAAKTLAVAFREIPPEREPEAMVIGAAISGFGQSQMRRSRRRASASASPE
jgi:hypothetical protein